MIERRLLQGAVALASLVPIAAGAAGIADSAAMLAGFERPLPSDLDSHYRYLSGLLFGIGVAFLSCVPRIEANGRRFRLLGAIVVVGGAARLLSLLEVGAPSSGHLFGLGMELVTVPLLMLWQARAERVARVDE